MHESWTACFSWLLTAYYAETTDKGENICEAGLWIKVLLYVTWVCYLRLMRHNYYIDTVSGLPKIAV